LRLNTDLSVRGESKRSWRCALHKRLPFSESLAAMVNDSSSFSHHPLSFSLLHLTPLLIRDHPHFDP
jgi:hypothetical protein